jgi:hypothetical protein
VAVTPAVKIKDLVIGSENIRFVAYATPTNYLLFGTSNYKKIFIINFSSDSFTLGQTMTLTHAYPIEFVSWNTPALGTNPNIAIGTRAGILDEYPVSFPATGTVSGISESARLNRWFVGCPITYTAYVGADTIVAGCSTGYVYWFSSSGHNMIGYLKLDLAPSDVAITLFRIAGNYLVCVLDLHVYIVDLISKTVTNGVSILPYVTPLSPYRAERTIRAISVYADPISKKPKTLITRTTESVIQYDLTSVMSGTFQPWKTGISVGDLVNLQSVLIRDSTMRRVSPDNDPYVSVVASEGAIDFVPCNTEDAQHAQVGDMTNIVCYHEPQTSSISPVVSLEIYLKNPFTKIRGSFKLQSSGYLPGRDCPPGRTPITTWANDQQSHWSIVTGSPGNPPISSCPLVANPWITSPGNSLSTCKNACMNDLTCNLIVTDKASSFCQLRVCDSPGVPPAPIDGFDLWVLARPQDASSPSYAGYVAFGTHDTVLYGGCRSPNGLIPTSASGSFSTISIPETEFHSLQSVLRIQVSQYSADARIRLSGLSLDLYSPYLTPTATIAEPSNMPGEFLLPIKDPRPGNVDVPMTLNPAGTVVITTNRHGYLGIYPLPLTQSFN